MENAISLPIYLSPLCFLLMDCLGILLNGSVPPGNELRSGLTTILSQCVSNDCGLRVKRYAISFHVLLPLAPASQASGLVQGQEL